MAVEAREREKLWSRHTRPRVDGPWAETGTETSRSLSLCPPAGLKATSEGRAAEAAAGPSGGEAVFPTVLTTYWRSLDWKEAHLTLSVAVLGMSVGVGEGSNGQDLAFDGHPQQDNSGQGAA